MKKILLLLFIPYVLSAQFPAPDSVYNSQGKIRYLEAGDTATKFQSTFNTLVAYANDTLATIDSVRAVIDSLANNLNETDPIYSASVASEIDAADTTRYGEVADSSWNTININNLQSKDSDSIIVDSTVYFNDGIKIKTVTESFSVSKTISYDAQYYAEMTITNNTAITVEDIPEGTSPQLALIWSGGDYTATISGATQMSGNSSTVLQEVDGATDLVQFKIINGTVYYSIINIVTP